MLDRIDIHIAVPRVDYVKIYDPRSGQSEGDSLAFLLRGRSFKICVIFRFSYRQSLSQAYNATSQKSPQVALDVINV